MKRFITTILSVLIVLPALLAQPKAQTFAANEKVWVGIDFTQTTFVGAEGFTNPSDLPRLIDSWNTFVVREAEKYDLKKFIDKKISIDLTQTTEKNKAINTAEVVKEEPTTITKEEAEKIALNYNTSEIDGFMVLMVAECFNKKEEAGTFWLVVVNAEDHSVFFSKRYEGKPGGFGIKNYWAKSFYNVLREIDL